MTRSRHQQKIEACRREIERHLEEARKINDLDLWQEIDGKLSDIMIVFRRSNLAPAPKPVQITPAQLAEQAFCSAVADFESESEGGA